MNVRDVMTVDVISVRPETPLKEVARTLSEHGISGVPVVDEAGGVVGVVSEADFLIKEQKQSRSGHSLLSSWLVDRAERQRVEAKLHATTAGEAMSHPPLTIGSGRPLREAAAVMTRNAVNRLPVVDEGKLVGIVTRADLVGTFLVPDDTLATRIVDEVLRETMWMERDEVTVSVSDGVARLAGTVDRRSTATILERLVSQVDGVVGVESELSWDLDDRSLRPVGDVDREPTAASVTSRARPRR